MQSRKKIISLILAGSMLMQVNTSKAHPNVHPLLAVGVLGGLATAAIIGVVGIIGLGIFACNKAIKHSSSPERQRKREERRKKRKAKRDARKAAKSKNSADKKTSVQKKVLLTT